MGSILQPSKQAYRVYAPCSHSLPVIRCLATDVEAAEIRLHQCDVGLASLEVLSPLFGKLWNDKSGPLGMESERLIQNTKRSTFQIVSTSTILFNRN
jgi:polynucleotide 5'-hydroxyl-kinase GRC3/NOL9